MRHYIAVGDAEIAAGVQQEIEKIVVFERAIVDDIFQKLKELWIGESKRKQGIEDGDTPPCRVIELVISSRREASHPVDAGEGIVFFGSYLSGEVRENI